MILRKLMVPKQRMVSMIDWLAFLLSLTMRSTSYMLHMVKLAPQLASLSDMPTPTSASRMAIRSLAPSPHIPTFHLPGPKTLPLKGSFSKEEIYSFLNLLTMSALFSGDILANSLMEGTRRGQGFMTRKSLSMARAYLVSQYSSRVSSIFDWMISSFSLNSKMPCKTPLPYLACFLPSSSTTFSPYCNIPARNPVSTAMKMLSPVIILGSMSDYTSLSIVALVSTFSLFSKATNPNAVMPSQNMSLYYCRQRLTWPASIYLYPQAMVLYPPKERLLTSVSKQPYLTTEFFSILSGAPLMKTQNLLSLASRTSTDIFWNLDSNWLILSTSSLSPEALSTMKRIAGSWEVLMLYWECRYILKSTSSPRSSSSVFLVVWQEAKSWLMSALLGVVRVWVMVSWAVLVLNLMMEQTSISFWVRVPVLSKQKVLTMAASVTFSGSVPMMFCHLRRTREKEQEMLKQMGKLGGKLQARMSRNLNTTKVGMIPFFTIMFTVHAQMTTPTVSVSSRKQTAERKKSGTLGTLVRILRMILPLLVAYPILTTTTLLSSRHQSTLAPSTSQQFSFLASPRSLAGNLPTGMLSPVRLASFTNTSPDMRMPSQLTSSFFTGTTTSPGTSSWFFTNVLLPSLMTTTSVSFSAMALILAKERQRRMQLMLVVRKEKPMLMPAKRQSLSRTQMMQMRYWKRKKGFVRVSNMYSKQLGTYTICSFLPNNTPCLSLIPQDNPPSRYSLDEIPKKFSQNWYPKGMSSLLSYRYFRFLKYTNMCLSCTLTLSISWWPSALSMKKYSAYSQAQSEQKQVTLKDLKYLRRSRPTKEAMSGMMTRMVFTRLNCRGLKEWTLHSPQSYLRRWLLFLQGCQMLFKVPLSSSLSPLPNIFSYILKFIIYQSLLKDIVIHSHTPAHSPILIDRHPHINITTGQAHTYPP